MDPDQAQQVLLGQIWIQIGEGEELPLAREVICKRSTFKIIFLEKTGFLFLLENIEREYLGPGKP